VHVSERECKLGRQRESRGEHGRPHADPLGSLANEAFEHRERRILVLIGLRRAVFSSAGNEFCINSRAVVSPVRVTGLHA